jgi:hypothetical protein
MMKDSLQYKSDEMIGIIAYLMCHHESTVFFDWHPRADDLEALLDSFAHGHLYKHRNALKYIVSLRGG